MFRAQQLLKANSFCQKSMLMKRNFYNVNKASMFTLTKARPLTKANLIPCQMYMNSARGFATAVAAEDSDSDEDFDLFDDIQEVLTQDTTEEATQKRIDDIMAPKEESDNALLVPPNINSFKLGKLIDKDPLDVLQQA